jgi:hypothetical protein
VGVATAFLARAGEAQKNPMAANPAPTAEPASIHHPKSKIQHPSFDTLGESSSNPTK